MDTEYGQEHEPMTATMTQGFGMTLTREQLLGNPLVDGVFRVELSFIETLFGSQPTSNIAIGYVRQKQIEAITRDLINEGMSRPKAQAQATERVAEDLPLADDEDDAPLKPTAFASDDEGLYLADYVVKNALKGMALVTKQQVPAKTKTASGKASATTDIQRLLWVFDGERGGRHLYLRRAGRIIDKADRAYERPLRAMTAQGPRVSIAVSEVLDPPISLTAEIVILRGCRITADNLAETLGYGMFEGMGVWRSGGWGRFVASVDQVR